MASGSRLLAESDRARRHPSSIRSNRDRHWHCCCLVLHDKASIERAVIASKGRVAGAHRNLTRGSITNGNEPYLQTLLLAILLIKTVR